MRVPGNMIQDIQLGDGTDLKKLGLEDYNAF